MAELSRRGLFKGLLGLVAVALVGKSEVTNGAKELEVYGVDGKNPSISYVEPSNGSLTLEHLRRAKQMLEDRRLLLTDLACFGTVVCSLDAGYINYIPPKRYYAKKQRRKNGR